MWFRAPTFLLVGLLCACTHDWDRYDPSKRGLGEGGVALPSDGGLPVVNVNCPAPNGRGPNLVGVPGVPKNYCIDATEVTRTQYQAFLTEGAQSVIPPAECATNADFLPKANWGMGEVDGNLPITYVDWCDARGFCEWAGKRLCARIGGGEYDLDSVSIPNKSEWFNACSYGGARAYPYGGSYQATSCRGKDQNAASDGGAVPVGSLSTCVGSVGGLFDMSGNVFEWEAACLLDPTTPTNSKCAYRGGGYGSTEDALRCARSDALGLAEVRPTIGFRCCADALPIERLEPVAE